jgi:nucleotide-binding universal stress UspA family protein
MNILPIHRILCPTDFSEPSKEAFEVAAELAEHFSSELVVLHVEPPLPVIPGTPATKTKVRFPSQHLETQISAKAKLDEFASTGLTGGLQVYPMLVEGDPADEILKVAAAEGVDLIVIATRGQGRLERLLVGSVTEKVLRSASCPVLTIQSGSPCD